MDEITFLINPVIDKTIQGKYPAPNWADLILNWLTPYLRDKFSQIHEEYYDKPYSNFITGVRNEYGIDAEVNIKKASFHFFLLMLSFT